MPSWQETPIVVGDLACLFQYSGWLSESHYGHGSRLVDAASKVLADFGTKGCKGWSWSWGWSRNRELLGEIAGLMWEIHLTAKNDLTRKNELTPCRSPSEGSDRIPCHHRGRTSGRPRSVDGSLWPRVLLHPFAHSEIACASSATGAVPSVLDHCGATNLQLVHSQTWYVGCSDRTRSWCWYCCCGGAEKTEMMLMLTDSLCDRKGSKLKLGDRLAMVNRWSRWVDDVAGGY